VQLGIFGDFTQALIDIVIPGNNKPIQNFSTVPGNGSADELEEHMSKKNVR